MNKKKKSWIQILFKTPLQVHSFILIDLIKKYNNNNNNNIKIIIIVMIIIYIID